MRRWYCRNTTNMISTKRCRRESSAERQKVVINKSPRHADGRGTATVGGKEAIKHRRGDNYKRNPFEFLFWVLEEKISCKKRQVKCLIMGPIRLSDK